MFRLKVVNDSDLVEEALSPNYLDKSPVSPDKNRRSTSFKDFDFSIIMEQIRHNKIRPRQTIYPNISLRK